MQPFSCPNCGDQVTPAFETLKITTCASCGTTLFLADAGATLAGEQGVMHEAPMLFGIGDQVMFDDQQIMIHGHARFSYGRGFWDEFWGVTDLGEARWVSVDEGDIVVQRVLEGDTSPDVGSAPKPGDSFVWNGETYTAGEVDRAECVALRGSFDEVLHVGETYRYINATSEYGDLLSGEFWSGGQRWFHGRWIDPYDIRVDRLT